MEEFEKLRSDLEGLGQSHLFANVDAASDDDFERFGTQLLKLDSTTPGGLVDYCKRGKRLIDGIISGAKDDREFGPPKLGEKLRANTPLFEECEEVGNGQAPLTAFVLVAGGLGERLSFNDAKVALETETLTKKNFLEMHCEWIAAFQHRARILTGMENFTTPFAIMTSDDTHKAIREMLSDDKGEMLCGLSDVTLLKQEKVPCFSNPNGDLALNPADNFELITKPHGHGDVHSLLFKSGLVERWLRRGIEWIVIFQDTNALAFRAVSAALGSSVRNRIDMNMVAVQRKRGEAVGAICNVKSREETGSSTVERTLNVEYNLINEDKFTDPSGGNVSLFPGNINLLVIRVQPYVQALRGTQGIVPEFINPKFANANKTEFKSPARLECMMQDLPLLLPASSRVGYIEMDRFMCFSAVKNNLKDALTKFQETGYPESASSCENDIYSTNRRLLAMSGCQIRTTALPIRRFAMIPFEDGARVVLAPSFGTTVAEIRSRFINPQAVFISDRSALVLEGDVIIHHLDLDGHLVLSAKPGCRLIIKTLRAHNAGSELDAVAGDMQERFSPSELIRGFYMKVTESLTIETSQPGETVIERPW